MPRRARLPLGFALCSVLAGACGPGDGAGQHDAGIDRPPFCYRDFGRSYIQDSIRLLPEGEGADFTGDGIPDNVLGRLGMLANPGFAESIATGNSIMLWDLLAWTDPPVPDDPDIVLVGYSGLDADVPADPSNNLTGTGQFVVTSDQFDLSCQPTGRFDQATLEGGVLRATSARWSVVVPGVGTLDGVDATFTATFSPDFSGFTDVMSVIAPACTLSRGDFPGSTEGSMLDILVNTLKLGPDIDRDGDGLEQIVGDGTTVAECLDGDGTVIPGPDCPCDPRIADGYSAALAGTAVRAYIVGVEVRP